MKFVGVFVLLFQVFLQSNAQAAKHDLCGTAMFHLANCLALQSDFNDEIDLKGKYSPSSMCIQGVKFYGGILMDDAKNLRATYHVEDKNKPDPLSRRSEVGDNMATTQYCAADISLMVAGVEESISIVFNVAEKEYHGDPDPEITIEF